jgi:hypothetical protein
VAGSSTPPDAGVRAIAKMQIGLNIEASAEHARVVCEMLTDGGWTADEIAAAGREIVVDAELVAIVRRAGAVTTEPFAELRRRREAKKTLGPCFTYGCRTPATVAAWGDIYCQSCYEGHVRKQRARDAQQYRINPDYCLRPPKADAQLDTLGGLIRLNGRDSR